MDTLKLLSCAANTTDTKFEEIFYTNLNSNLEIVSDRERRTYWVNGDGMTEKKKRNGEEKAGVRDGEEGDWLVEEEEDWVFR